MTLRPLTTTRSFHYALLGALAAASLVACSDAGEETAAATSSAAATTGAGGESASSTTAATTGAGGDTSSSTSSAGGGGGGGEVVTPEITFLDMGMPLDLTPDGGVALIQDPTKITGDVYFYDTVTGDLAKKTEVGDATKDLATGISANLRVSALHGVPVFAGIFSETDGWLDLASPFATGCDPDFSGAFDISADGNVAVGLLWNGCKVEAFRWVDTGGAGTVTPLALVGTSFNGGAPNNRASVVSDDGKIAAGFAELSPLDRSPARWTEDGQGILLDPQNTDAPGEVLSIDEDGKTLAGNSGYDGFRWTEQDGFVLLERLPSALPSDPTFPNAIAAHGQLIFGGVGDAFSGIPIAFVWTEAEGSRSLQDIAVAAGVDIPEGTILGNVLAASNDGTVLLGFALTDAFETKSFVLKLPVSAYGIGG